jgi:hypothetical protein
MGQQNSCLLNGLALLLHIRELPVSNLGTEASYPDFSQYLQQNAGIVQ